MHGYNFTEGVRAVLAGAREEAADRKEQYVAPEHMLLALIHGSDPMFGGIIAAFDVDASAIEREVMGRMEDSQAFATGPDLPFTSRAKKVLELAMNEAYGLQHSYVGAEHLLLGLIREEKSIAAQALTALGIQLEPARRVTLRLLGESAKPARPSTEMHLRLTGSRPLTRQLADIIGDAPDASTPEEILVALLADNGGARHILEVMDVELDTLQAEIAGRREGLRGAATSVHQLYDAAVIEQQYLGDLALATHHMLLAYLALRPAHGYRALSDRGVTHASVRALAERIFG